MGQSSGSKNSTCRRMSLVPYCNMSFNAPLSFHAAKTPLHTVQKLVIHALLCPNCLYATVTQPFPLVSDTIINPTNLMHKE